MAQMNLSTKRKQMHRHREQICDCCKGEAKRVGWIGSLGLVDENYYI